MLMKSTFIYIWTNNQCVYVLHSDKKQQNKKNTKFVWRIFVFF